MRKKVFIIGLDGATFDVITPLIKDGWMPNLKNLIENGASGSLQSTVPPITGPTWLALATGIRPERIGFFDFFYRKDSSYRLRGMSSTIYRGRAVWDYLSQIGKKVGILNYPMLRPPYEINGFMSTGMGASPDDEFTFPKGLKKELNKVAGGHYELYIPYHNSRYNDTNLFFKDLNRVFDKHVRVTEYLLKEKEWDLFWVVFSETDWLLHSMWQHIDKNHPLYKGKNSEKYTHIFRKFWGKIDEAIGYFQSFIGKNTNIIVLSDHGFGPNDQVFKLNAWLEREGYLVRKKQAAEKTLYPIKQAIRSLLPKIARGIKLNRLMPGLYKWGQEITHDIRVGILDQIDLEKSIALDPGHTIQFGGIYINDQVVDTHQERQKLASEIAERLKDWGEKYDMKIEIWLPSGLEKGPYLIVGINEWRCVMQKSQFDGKLLEQRPYSSRYTGSHRMNGIFIAAGPDIQRVKISKANICDVTPTLLYLFDHPIPSIMDGNILRDIFNPEYLEKHPPKHQSKKMAKEAIGPGKVGSDLTEEDEEAIQKQLKDLGYI